MYAHKSIYTENTVRLIQDPQQSPIISALLLLRANEHDKNSKQI